MRTFSFFAFLILSASRLFAAEGVLEYQVKAVCVLNAARFVSWPASAFDNSSAPLVIGILGDNPFGSALQDVVAGETLHERRIVVRRVALSEAATVQVLFISNSQRGHLDEILRALGNASVLTISEIDRFTENGGMLGLALDRGKIRFEVNPEAVGRAQLKIDSQFLLLTRTK
jgi:YfiR/HmsC-like